MRSVLLPAAIAVGLWANTSSLQPAHAEECKGQNCMPMQDGTACKGQDCMPESGPGVECKGDNCLPPQENPVDSCTGADCLQQEVDPGDVCKGENCAQAPVEECAGQDCTLPQ
jgi:hypothetical protein